MSRAKVVLGILFLLGLTGVCLADESGDDSKIVTDFWRCASPTNGFWGLNDKLAPSGIEVGLGLTTVYQTNVHGGTSTNERRGRHVGRYDLEMSMDMEELLGIEGGSFFVHGWGGWPIILRSLFPHAHGVFANRAASDYPADYESVFEAYYNAHITPWFVFGPSIQYVANPTGGEGSTSKDAVLFGLRAQMTF